MREGTGAERDLLDLATRVVHVAGVKSTTGVAKQRPVTSKWLLLLYQLPAKPSTLRVNVWRELKTCGVVYVQHSACVLPNRPSLRAKMEVLKGVIEKSRGETRLFVIQLTDAKEQENLAHSFRSQAEEEYGEFLERCDDLHAELSKERTKDHYSFAELEENEVEMGKLRAWLKAIIARDFFHVPLRGKALSGLARAEKDFRLYHTQVVQRQPIHGRSSVGALPKIPETKKALRRKV